MTASPEPEQVFDLIIRNGNVYDGSGGEPYVADVAVTGDRVTSVGRHTTARARSEIDAAGMAVAPGFINMLSHSYISMLQDPRSLGELKQGVTLQIFGEGNSMGPLTPEMHERMQAGMDPDMPVDVTWRTLAEYLAAAEKRGVSQNVASYIGATTLRIYAVGHDDRPATAAEMDVMRGLVRDEMSAGALGIGSSLIYPPAFFAPTEELVELCRAAAPYDGKYISHMRDEGGAIIEAVNELMRISREGGVRAEIYHLKAAGKDNWPKMDRVIEMVEAARAAGEPISADMYLYPAGATALSAAIPPRFHEGGPRRLLERLHDPAERGAIRSAILGENEGWENLYRGASDGNGVLILGVRRDEHRQYQGKTLAQVAAMMGVDEVEALMNLVRDDRSRVETAYFTISEDNIRKEVQLPWVSFGSDSPSWAAEGAFLKRSTHPRAYGNFARLLGKYVRDERLVTLPEAVRRLTRLPAENLGLRDRGRIAEGFFADVVVFDPATIADRATFEAPQQYAVGVRDVIVNGTAALRDGEFTGDLPGRAVYGPGKR
jgi:N-acyl-D-amino-acid deacylase